MNTITAEQAFAIFQDGVNTSANPTASTVYWDALESERMGHITVAELDAISVYHKDAIVTMHREHREWEEADARLQAEVHQAQSDYWDDHEAGTLSSSHYA